MELSVVYIQATYKYNKDYLRFKREIITHAILFNIIYSNLFFLFLPTRSIHAYLFDIKLMDPLLHDRLNLNNPPPEK